MKNPSKTLSLLLASAVLLTACGGEKPSEPAKSEPSTQTAPAELADTVPKADEVAITNSATSDKTDKGTVETAQVDNAEQADTAPAPVQGFGKMAAQVTGEVSEAEVYAAVDYMVSQVQ